uniref:Uncharacterized protein n=1 Tax=Solanum tuberosum TaxID=4113 RepID=M1DWC9_SOLTU
MMCECPNRLNVLVQGGELYLDEEVGQEEGCEEETQEEGEFEGDEDEEQDPCEGKDVAIPNGLMRKVPIEEAWPQEGDFTVPMIAPRPFTRSQARELQRMQGLFMKLEVLELILMAKKGFHVWKIAWGSEGKKVEETDTLGDQELFGELLNGLGEVPRSSKVTGCCQERVTSLNQSVTRLAH